MSKEKYKKITYLILVLVWMFSVFMFSNQNGKESGNTSQNITRAIIEILTYNRNISAEEKINLIESADYYIRKLAHYSIYAIGEVLIYNYINTYNVQRKKAILISIIIGIIYAITDELHQYFTEGRSAQITDVIIDSLGIITGVITISIVKKLRKPLNN